jgi:hypothetical protein
VQAASSRAALRQIRGVRLASVVSEGGIVAKFLRSHTVSINANPSTLVSAAMVAMR